MAGLEDIKDVAIGEIDSAERRALNIPSNQLDSYKREFGNKALGTLDAKKDALELTATNSIKEKTDSYFKFILSSFGLEKVKVNEFQQGRKLDSNDSFSGQTGYLDESQFRYQDTSGKTNMHSSGAEPLTSILGTPVFSDLILENKDRSLSQTLLWVLVDVKQTKNIVKTKVQGRDGEVKEYISDGDYIVNLRGAFVNTFQKSYPKEVVKQLIRLCQEKDALNVTSEYLLMFNIHELVVEEFNFSQEEGKQNIQKFELRCSSDIPLVLKKKAGV